MRANPSSHTHSTFFEKLGGTTSLDQVLREFWRAKVAVSNGAYEEVVGEDVGVRLQP